VPRPSKRYSQRTGKELEEATKDLDEEFAFLKSRPLNKRERQRHAKGRKRGRPRIGEGAEKIRVSIERGLLARSDAYVRKHGMSRSELIAKGLKAIMAARSA
jgi:hypothetical protein